MTALSIEELRAVIAKRVAAYVDQHQNQPGYKVPPPQIVEALIDLETGGTYDPGFVDPSSGALGLGNITLEGTEWGLWKAIHPDAQPDDLLNADTNVDVVINGLSARQSSGQIERDAGGTGSYADWYMAAAGYFGGANEAGFNTSADSYGTTGQDYVRRLRAYITRVWSAETARDIDLLQPGAAVAAGGDWGEGAITFDPNAGATDKSGELLGRLFSNFKTGLSIAANLARDSTSGITDPIGDAVRKAFGEVYGAIVFALPRVGLAVGGLALAVVGLLVLLRAPISGAIQARAAG